MSAFDPSGHRRFKIKFGPRTQFSGVGAYLFEVTSVTARTRAARYRESKGD
jgi:hypothetical protein